MARFYIEGDEIDVQDPTFFIEEQKIIELKITLEDYIADYAPVCMEKQKQESVL